MFLSVILWFILGDESETAILIDGDRVYAVLNVISGDGDVSQSNFDCDMEDRLSMAERTNSFHSERFSSVSKRMIEQLFTAEEGPDRDWLEYDALEEDVI